MHHKCVKCSKTSAWLLLIIGLIFLLVDLGVWTFWNINWWTVGFLYMGMGIFGWLSCKECQKMGK